MKYLVFFLLVFMAFNSSSQNFYFGNDLSYVNQMEDGGAVYKENMQAKDVYHIFADHGTNLVRVRLWVDPSWWQSPLQQPAGVKPFYNDIVDVKETIRRSKEAGMKVMLDMQGQTMKQVEFKSAGNQTVNVSDIPPGLYVFKIQGNKRIDTFKMLLQ